MQHKMQNIRPVNPAPGNPAPGNPAPGNSAPVNSAPVNLAPVASATVNPAQKEEKHRVKDPLASVLQQQIEGTCSKNSFMLQSTEDLMKMSKKRKEQSLPAPPLKRLKLAQTKESSQSSAELQTAIHKVCSKLKMNVPEKKSIAVINPEDITITARGRKAVPKYKPAVEKKNMKKNRFCSPIIDSKITPTKSPVSKAKERITKSNSCSSKIKNKNTPTKGPVKKQQEDKTKSEKKSLDDKDSTLKDLFGDDYELSDDESVSSPQENESKSEEISLDEQDRMLQGLLGDEFSLASSSSSDDKNALSSKSEDISDKEGAPATSSSNSDPVTNGKTIEPPLPSLSTSLSPKQTKAAKKKGKVLSKKDSMLDEYRAQRVKRTNEYLSMIFPEDYRKRRLQKSSPQTSSLNDQQVQDQTPITQAKQMEAKVQFDQMKQQDTNMVPDQPKPMETAVTNSQPQRTMANVVNNQPKTINNTRQNKSGKEAIQRPVNALPAGNNAHPNIVRRQQQQAYQISGYTQPGNPHNNQMSGYYQQGYPNQMSAYNQHGYLNQMSGYNQPMNQTQMSGYSQHGYPNQMSGYNQPMNQTQMSGYNQHGYPNQMSGYNQHGIPNMMSGQPWNPNQLWNPHTNDMSVHNQPSSSNQMSGYFQPMNGFPNQMPRH